MKRLLTLNRQRKIAVAAWHEICKHISIVLRTDKFLRSSDEVSLEFDVECLRLILAPEINPHAFRGAYAPAIGKYPAAIRLHYGNAHHFEHCGQDMHRAADIEQRLDSTRLLKKIFNDAKDGLDDTIKKNFLWIDFLSTNLEAVLSSLESSFVHEYVHHLDVLAAKKNHKRYLPQRRPRCARSYYNLPLEQYAYLQQALHAMDVIFCSITSKRYFYQIFGASADDFLQRKFQTFLNENLLHVSFQNNLNYIFRMGREYYLSAEKSFV